MLAFHIVTLFPEFFDSPLSVGLLARARARNLISFSFRNPRDFSEDKHRHVDDAPYGGGPGMVLQAPPVVAAVRSLVNPGRIICLSPSGRQLNPQIAAELAAEENITLVCGRYEGIDRRAIEILGACEIAVGEAVLNGGETAALALVESVSRFLPQFLGAEESAQNESFTGNLLEYDQYTRPERFASLAVPPVLLGGNHGEIAAWRRRNSLLKTMKTRPDLLARASLDKKDADALATRPATRPGRNLSFCLMHYPVKTGENEAGVSSLTNLDIHDIARISRSYGMAAFYALTPLSDQLELLRGILAHWLDGADTDRAAALRLTRPVASFEEMDAVARELHGETPIYLAASAQWPKKPALAPCDALELLRVRPVIICLGTARGLSRGALARCDGQLRPLRFLSDNHLSVRAAAAILADRILGDFC